MHDDSITRNDLQRAALLALQELCELGVEDLQRQKLEALWILSSRPDSSRLVARPLRPRYGMYWELDLSISVVVDDMNEFCSMHSSVNEVVKLLLTRLEVEVLDGERIQGVHWRSDQREVSKEITSKTRKHYGQIFDSGFFSGVWVHKEDRSAFQVDVVMNALQENFRKLQNDIHQGFDDLSADLREIDQGLEGNSARLTNMVQTLLEACHDSGDLPPKLALILPKNAAASFDPRTWFTSELHIVFLCDVTLQPGIDEEGNVVNFTICQPREFLQKAFPYIKLGLLVVQAALLSGRLLGYPVPEISGLYNVFTEASQVAGAMAELVEALEEEVQGNETDASFDYTALLEAGSVAEDRVEYLREQCEANFKIVKGMMDGIDAKWQENCGLVWCTADDGTSAWVRKDVEQAFRESGREMLRMSGRQLPVEESKQGEPGGKEEQLGRSSGRQPSAEEDLGANNSMRKDKEPGDNCACVMS
uniref:Uncharacterized protein n=1 Tax=Pinguiococcus pyrenoidosus TaxID=172671 RepID=A0A7R9U935_9STRA|mmetsp:Transcript_19747/g.74687  ORF Transcript_19747/g.74687 Transcript_19747/m.74687 type:complete len:477 (+) Transcript_19747:2-1432(+)